MDQVNQLYDQFNELYDQGDQLINQAKRLDELLGALFTALILSLILSPIWTLIWQWALILTFIGVLILTSIAYQAQQFENQAKQLYDQADPGT